MHDTEMAEDDAEHTQQRATRRWDSIRVKRSEKQSHVAVTVVPHVGPTDAPCCPGRPSTT